MARAVRTSGAAVGRKGQGCQRIAPHSAGMLRTIVACKGTAVIVSYECRTLSTNPHFAPLRRGSFCATVYRTIMWGDIMASKTFRFVRATSKLLVDMLDGTHAERVLAQPPLALITGTTKPRLRVDVGQTGFFEKREFETFREFAAATTGTYVLRVVSPINFILQDLAVELEAGSARLATFSGGTPTGVFSETLPYVAANTMTETPAAYTPQLALTAIPSGGSLAGGSAIRVTRIKAADNSNFASSVGSTPDLVVGRGPGTYYIVLTLTAAIGVLKGRFEERP